MLLRNDAIYSRARLSENPRGIVIASLSCTQACKGLQVEHHGRAGEIVYITHSLLHDADRLGIVFRR